MSNEIEFEGFEEIEELLQDMTISEEDEKKAMSKAIEPIETELEKNTPEGETKRLKKTRKLVKKEGFATVGTVNSTAFYDIFQELGTSTQKRNVGYFEKSVRSAESEAISILAKELLNKAN